MEQQQDHEEAPDFGDQPGAPLRRALWVRGQEFLHRLMGSAETMDEENIHEMRVASRRLNATLEMIAELIGDRPVRKLNREIRKARRACGRYRDTQVQLERVQEDEALTEFAEHLSEGLDDSFRKARKKLQRIDPDKIEERLELVDGLIAALSENDESWEECLQVLRRTVQATYEECLECQGQVDLDRTPTIHPFRIALKKFRYQLEVMTDLDASPLGEEHWEQLKSLHKAIGTLQDIEVITQHLDCYWAAYPPVRHEQLKVLGQLLKERRANLEPLQSELFDLSELWDR